MNDYAAFLRAICDSPDDDAPRLIMADWLEERGDTRRADFIRAQVLLASPQCPKPGCKDRSWLVSNGKKVAATGMRNYCPHCRCAYCKVKRAEWLAWRHKGCDWQGEFYKVFAEHEVAESLRTGRPIERHPLSPARSCEFRRGFIEQIQLSAADALQHLDAILAAHPVREVTLTTWPEASVEGRYDQRLRFTAGGVTLAGETISFRKLLLTNEWKASEVPSDGRELMAGILKTKWPQVKTWNLPKPEYFVNRGSQTRPEWHPVSVR